MKNTLVVVVDLGCLKAFKIDNSRDHSTPRLELVEEFNNADAHERLVEKVTDLSGRFRRATRAATGGAMSDGERHNIQLEQRKRCVRALAARFTAVFDSTQPEHCFLAASREINNPLLAELEPRVRTKIERNLPVDLTKVDKSRLLGHFRS